MSYFGDIQPEALWRHFGDLCPIPRPSRHEEAVCTYIKQFGEKLGLETIVDEVGNVITRKPATLGMVNLFYRGMWMWCRRKILIRITTSPEIPSRLISMVTG